MATSPSNIAFSQVLWKQANGKQRGKPHFYEETHRNVTSSLNPAENPNRGVLLPVSVTTKFQFQLSEKQFFSQSLSKTITVWVWWTRRCYSMLIPALPLILFEPAPWRCPLWGVSSQWRQQAEPCWAKCKPRCPAIIFFEETSVSPCPVTTDPHHDVGLPPREDVSSAHSSPGSRHSPTLSHLKFTKNLLQLCRFVTQEVVCGWGAAPHTRKRGALLLPAFPT